MANVKILGEAREIRFAGKNRGEDILRKLGLKAGSTIIMRNGKPVPEDIMTEEEDDITIIKSFSGG